MQVEEEEWVEHTLIDYERKKRISKVLTIDSSDAVPKGANYASDMHRLKLKVVTKAGDVEGRQIIYKALPVTEHRRIGMKQAGLFLKEARVYLESIPEMERIQKTKEVGDNFLWPICFGVKRGGEGYLLEDLCAIGYKMGDRMKGLDFDHASFVVRELAKFHAISAVGVRKGDIAVADYNGYFLAQNKEIITAIYCKHFNELVSTIENNWKGEWLEYAERVKKLSASASDKLMESLKRDDTKFNVLNHGDCWLNNIMFKYGSGGELKCLRFLDYQLVHYNSPGYDLQYFFNTSLYYELNGRKPELVKIYYDSLKKNLELFEYPSPHPTYEDILESYEKASIFGLSAALTFRTVMMMPPTAVPDMEELSKAYAEKKDVAMSNFANEDPIFLATIQASLREGKEMGLL